MKLKQLNLTVKLTLAVIIVSAGLCSGCIYTGYRNYKASLMRQYTERALDIAFMAASVVSGDDVPRYLSTNEKDGAYMRTDRLMTSLIDSMKAEYIYIFYPNKKGYQYVFDAKKTGGKGTYNELGAIEPYVATTENMMRIFRTGKVDMTRSYVTNSSEGYFVSVFAPVFGSNGKATALAGVDLSMTKIINELNAYTMKLAFWTVLFILAVAAAFFFYLKKHIVTPVQELTRGAQEFADQESGSLELKPVAVETGDELQILGGAFNKMQRDILSYIEASNKAAAEKERTATELAMATSIQKDALPDLSQPSPYCCEFDVFSTMEPAKEVGGDFYDLVRISEERAFALIADVSGKGVPAALFMMIAKALLKMHILDRKTLSEAFSAVNDQLAFNNENSMFVTAFGCIYDSGKNTLSYCSAGHNPPLIRRAGGVFEYMEPSAEMPLASIEGLKYREETIPFAKGDMLFLYTDGVTEALNEKEELYGEERLIDEMNSIRNVGSAPLKEITSGLLADVRRFAGTAEQADDITILILRAGGGA